MIITVIPRYRAERRIGGVGKMAFQMVSPILSTSTVTVGPDSIHYGASGMLEAGFAALFLHEAGGSGATWDGQLVGLARQARCLVPDLPGHGNSVGVGFESIAEHRQAMLGFLDALAIRWPVVIAGVCLGAAVAIDIALHAPHRVAGLILSGLHTGSWISPEAYEQAARGEVPDGFVDGMFSPLASPRLQAEQRRRWRLTNPVVRYRDLVALQGYPVRTALGRVACPYVELPGAFTMLEQPDVYNQVVAKFLAELQPAVPVVPAVAYGGGYRRSLSRRV